MSGQAIRTRFIDVSVGVSPATPVWPGAPPFELTRKTVDLDGGQIGVDSYISMTAHCGTHIDAPLHCITGGQTVDAVALDLLIGPCHVLEHAGDRHMTKKDLLAMGSVTARRVLIKTRNSNDQRRGTLDKNYISLLPDALDHLMQSGVQLLGVDGFSIGPYGEFNIRNHLTFCGAGGIIIEMLDLSDVEAGEYSLVALPIRLEGAEAAPARVVLLTPEDVGNVFRVGAARRA